MFYSNLLIYLYLKPTFPLQSTQNMVAISIHLSQNPTVFCLLANSFIERCSSLTCGPLLSCLSLLAHFHGIARGLLCSTSDATVQEFDCSDQQKYKCYCHLYLKVANN